MNQDILIDFYMKRIHCIGMKKNLPESSERLRYLLDLIGLTGTELCRMTGTSYVLFLKVHGGDRSMTLEYAELIMMALGVKVEWLLGKQGDRKHPVGVNGAAYDKASFESWSRAGGSKQWLNQDVSREHGYAPLKLNEMVWKLVKLAVAATRHNRLWIVYYHFEKFAEATAKALKVERSMRSESVVFLSDNGVEISRMSTKELETAVKRTGRKTKENKFYAESVEFDTTERNGVAATFNPVFLFELSEGCQAGQREQVHRRLNLAEERLSSLKRRVDWAISPKAT